MFVCLSARSVDWSQIRRQITRQDNQLDTENIHFIYLGPLSP